MNARDRVERTLNHQPVDRAPRDLWALPGVSVKRKDEFTRLMAEYPTDLQGAASPYGRSRYAKGRPMEDPIYRTSTKTVKTVAGWLKVGVPTLTEESLPPRLQGKNEMVTFWGNRLSGAVKCAE